MKEYDPGGSLAVGSNRTVEGFHDGLYYFREVPELFFAAPGEQSGLGVCLAGFDVKMKRWSHLDFGHVQYPSGVQAVHWSFDY